MSKYQSFPVTKCIENVVHFPQASVWKTDNNHGLFQACARPMRDVVTTAYENDDTKWRHSRLKLVCWAFWYCLRSYFKWPMLFVSCHICKRGLRTQNTQNSVEWATIYALVLCFIYTLHSKFHAKCPSRIQTFIGWQKLCCIYLFCSTFYICFIAV